MNAINLFDGGSASNKAGFQIKLEWERRDSRPLLVQLQINENKILTANKQLKRKVVSLIKQYDQLWAYHKDNPTYGKTKDMQFEIVLLNKTCRPIKHKYRPLNELQKQSLLQQIQDWKDAGVVTLHDTIPSDAWVSPFHGVLKPLKGEKPIIRWTVDMRSINNHTAPLTISLPSVEDNILQLANSKYFSCLDFSQRYHHMNLL